ncbi:MAG: carbohydrate ABC transporter permease [Opitutales bacterium]|nr:carbohydrate ABC transporter permease [Opitutales bacterium]MCH8539860.1 carbohydrate ABC transporter permease [Opitutales bacterium]
MKPLSSPPLWYRILGYGILFLGAVLFFGPILFMLIASLKPDHLVLSEAGSWRAFFPSEASLDNYRSVFTRVSFVRFLLNSLFITGTIVAAGLVVNSLAGYAFARLPWKGRHLFFLLVLALLILPFEAIAAPLFYQMTEMGWRNSYQVQIIPFIANAFSIYLFYTFFLGLPRELEESAMMDGAGPWRTYWQVIVPTAKPAFASVAILTFLLHWGNYLWPLMVTVGDTYRPLPVAIASFQTLPPIQWGDIMAFGVMMVAPVMVVFLWFQRWFVQGVAASGMKN